MKIEVRLFATLAAYLPPGRHARGPLDVPEGSCVADIPALLGIPDALPRMVLVNGEDAPADRPLTEGDALDLFPPLAGG